MPDLDGGWSPTNLDGATTLEGSCAVATLSSRPPPLPPPTATRADAVLDALRRGGLVMLMRHARTVPGTGDPPESRLNNCATQRNLGEEGRAQARAIGARLRAERIPIGAVRSSAWCRCRETAELLDLGPGRAAAALEQLLRGPLGRGRASGRHPALRRGLAGAWQRDARHPSGQHHRRHRRLPDLGRDRRHDRRSCARGARSVTPFLNRADICGRPNRGGEPARDRAPRV